MTKLAGWMNRAMEGLWLAALVFAPIYFNVYSSRVFDPDKVAVVRSLATLAAACWLIKLIEGWRMRRESAETENAEATAWWRVPLVLPLALFAGWYVVSSLLSVSPRMSIFGSYARVEGLISQLSYITLGLVVAFNLRTRAQVERLINFALAATVPAVLYALVQHEGMDPLPWAGDVMGRPASTFGNPTFLGTWLVMMLPLILYRLVTLIAYLRESYRTRQIEDDTLRVAVFAATLIGQNLVLWTALNMIAGIREPSPMLWLIFPIAILLYCMMTGVYASAGFSRGVGWLGAIAVAVLLLATSSVILFTQSRGPLVGMLVAVMVFAIVSLWVRHSPQLSLALGASAAVLLLVVMLNIGALPVSSLREVKYLDRFATLTQVNEGTGKVLATVWQGTANLLLSDTLRLTIGFGPETMYITYNPYYPADLQHWELRNSTPDQNHNWVLDQLVWTGLIGLALLVLLLLHFYAYTWHEAVRAGPLDRQLLFAALIAAISAYLVATLVANQTVASWTYFFTFIGLAVAVGHFGASERPTAVISDQ